eukprot:626370-Lingulodinium_polyedra.AAC.1
MANAEPGRSAFGWPTANAETGRSTFGWPIANADRGCSAVGLRNFHVLSSGPRGLGAVYCLCPEGE